MIENREITLVRVLSRPPSSSRYALPHVPIEWMLQRVRSGGLRRGYLLGSVRLGPGLGMD